MNKTIDELIDELVERLNITAATKGELYDCYNMIRHVKNSCMAVYKDRGERAHLATIAINSPWTHEAERIYSAIKAIAVYVFRQEDSLSITITHPLCDVWEMYLAHINMYAKYLNSNLTILQFFDENHLCKGYDDWIDLLVEGDELSA